MSQQTQHCVKHYMTPDPLTFSETNACENALTTLLQARVSGAPVVNDAGELVGVFSINDLFDESPYPLNYYDSILSPLYDNANTPYYDGDLSHIMSKIIHTASPEEPMGEAAQKMLDKRVHRLIVIDDETFKPIGILSSFDVLKVVASKCTSQPLTCGS